MLPLTFQQQWLLERALQHTEWHCSSGYTYRLKGVLDLDVLRRSFKEIVRRHGSLRVRIVSIEGATGQAIDDASPGQMDIVPIHGTSDEEIVTNAHRAAEALYDLRVNLSTGPLWTVAVLRLRDREHWLVLVMHRLIAECSSIERVFQELRSLYDELKDGCPSTFPSAPPQYADYAALQHKTRGDWAKRHEVYWSDRLAAAAPMHWPVDADVAVSTPASPGKVSRSFGSALSIGVRELAQKLRVLSATIMLAVYAATLWRWSRQNDFVLPFNVAGRQSEHRPVVGYFSYILYLRVELAGEETFREFLSRITNEFYRALAHQDFGRIATQRPDLLAGTLFQWTTWHPDDAARPASGASTDSRVLAIDRVPIREFGEGLTIAPPSMVDVEITLFDTVDELCALGTYRADRFTAQTMERFTADLCYLTEQFVRNPDARLAAL